MCQVITNLILTPHPRLAIVCLLAKQPACMVVCFFVLANLWKVHHARSKKQREQEESVGEIGGGGGGGICDALYFGLWNGCFWKKLCQIMQFVWEEFLLMLAVQEHLSPNNRRLLEGTRSRSRPPEHKAQISVLVVLGISSGYHCVSYCSPLL